MDDLFDINSKDFDAAQTNLRGEHVVFDERDVDRTALKPVGGERHFRSILTSIPNNFLLNFRCELQWKWSSYYSRQGVRPSDITTLEMQTFLVQARCLFRDESYHSSRLLQVFDSDGSLGAYAKGRSSSRRMNRLCRKNCALQVFVDSSFFFSWCNSECMPLDKASREFPTLRATVFPRYLNMECQMPEADPG